MTFVASMLLVVAIGASAAPVPLPAQQAPAFEVASVKPSRPDDSRRRTVLLQPGGGFIAANITLRELVQSAYGLNSREVVGGPDWIDTERFDITAKVEGNHVLDVDGMPRQTFVMLQGLLSERFRLRVHSETRELPIYAFMAVRNDGTMGPQLRRSDVDCVAVLRAMRDGQRPEVQPGRGPPCSVGHSNGRIVGNAITIERFADVLSTWVDRKVLDQTGLDGNFDVQLEWQPAPGEYSGRGGADDSLRPQGDGVSIFTALQEQLGLRLRATTGPVGVLVIDRAERPTPD
jgi:uncharacterized protein (TIGR03435 family)